MIRATSFPLEKVPTLIRLYGAIRKANIYFSNVKDRISSILHLGSKIPFFFAKEAICRVKN
tara:strand:- start:102 stop:284 length:183 start_codon:yes stop_codon:yes gene_type:complete